MQIVSTGIERKKSNSEQQHGSIQQRPRGPPVQRKPLKHRDYEVDLESRLGKTQVVTPIAPLSQQAGYYCSVCECVVKDSANYLDHINGKKHFDERILKQQQEEEEKKRQRREKKKEKKKEKAAEEEPEVDPDVAAMMGFGGFRSSKK
ncbi:UNVERIFIED_CONTAM: Zinc finger matrin-type protein 2 [Sesamum calycinum]|uniref:Zinc finger matrin-type protein 2 n=1 Tax=Sesamum calycinum TaxID=2727403 RepID=A0AAW2R720_9LAMI